MNEHMMAAEIAALKNEIETLKGMVKAERAKVIAEISAWVTKNQYAIHYDYCLEVDYAVASDDLLIKLDSMEDKTNV